MKKFARSVGLALEGISYAIRTQSHMRIHMLAALLVVVAGFILALDTIEWSLIILCMAMVISAELVNTAIEQTVDLASPAIHPLAKKAKDIAAGAVLLTAIGAVIIALLIFGKHIW
ncbi:diacylglycerol kinase family protein [Paenibacillus sp. HB172176]|uniref:diacylglycerol kinase family protein n=1 Tax=Paenibacillus sp. HB172176 TaxID=2493690 RepID=UPI00143BC2E5|nr:diacylglycerol kinase family protein [Paenibacillus sp. HB172176]